MASNEIVELSVEETNELRAKLGLVPLRTESSSVAEQPSDQQEELELSVDDSNALRHKLGLAPLRVDGSSSRQALHKPAENTGEQESIQQRLERSKLEKEVQRGIASNFAKKSIAEEEDGGTAMSWAAKMRAQKKTKSKKKKKSKASTEEQKYDEHDLEGMNVSHGVSDFEAGSTTILTLADAPLLKTKDESSSKVVGLNEELHTLENVQLTEREVQRDGLRKKRQAELGMGRAGGYAGYDDDEFEELGGTQGPSRLARGLDAGEPESGSKAKSKGFQIGNYSKEEQEQRKGLFAFEGGKAISLDPTTADVAASDFMTVEEDALQHKSKKKKKKETKFKKKKKKDKNHKRKERVESDDESPPANGLLKELEATAVGSTARGKKRRRSDGDDEEETDKDSSVTMLNTDNEAKKREKFESIMAKANKRTALAFQEKPKPPAPVVEEEPDDAFLDAALAKARRLRRLKQMSSKDAGADRGADAVVRQVNDSKSREAKSETNGGVAFSADDTREFTRALRARAEQAERKEARKKKEEVAENDVPPEEAEEVGEAAPVDDNVDMMELAKEIKEDDVDDVQTGGFDETASTAVPMGRGLAGALSILRHTGEITGKHAGKEELRGRAKDERTYEAYKDLDLSKVVRLGKGATEKDLEFANREIKLEYRDEHGRLLAPKAAYRELCYQFHGHGSSYKNEEKKLRQIATERAAQRVASRQVADAGKGAGSLGALKATQQATGKAFVVHRT